MADNITMQNQGSADKLDLQNSKTLLEQQRQDKIKQLQEDYEAEWWKAGAIDDFNVKNKLLRVGCRPIKRKYLACQKSYDYDIDTYSQCKKLRERIDECYETLKMIQIQNAQENIEKESLQNLINKGVKHQNQNL